MLVLPYLIKYYVLRKYALWNLETPFRVCHDETFREGNWQCFTCQLKQLTKFVEKLTAYIFSQTRYKHKCLKIWKYAKGFLESSQELSGPSSPKDTFLKNV